MRIFTKEEIRSFRKISQDQALMLNLEYDFIAWNGNSIFMLVREHLECCDIKGCPELGKWIEFTGKGKFLFYCEIHAEQVIKSQKKDIIRSGYPKFEISHTYKLIVGSEIFDRLCDYIDCRFYPGFEVLYYMNDELKSKQKFCHLHTATQLEEDLKNKTKINQE